jgi:hypothetical protein
MKHNFINEEGAFRILVGSENPAVRGALVVIHQGVLCCAGIPIPVIRKPRVPTEPLDLIWFYEAVAYIISNWDDSPFTPVEADGVNASQVDELLSNLDEASQAALGKVANALSGIPRQGKVDEAFCVWLFAETILVHQLLGRVLDGSIGRKSKELETAGFEAWASEWT